MSVTSFTVNTMLTAYLRWKKKFVVQRKRVKKMNRVLSWFYRFRPIRLAWWRFKRCQNRSFNDREGIQELMDLGARIIHLASGVYNIDATLHLRSNLIGSGRRSYFKEKVN